MEDIVIAILIDLKKAFDTVDHKILLRKLYAYNIWGNMLNWFESYLSHRTLYVVFDAEKSDTDSIKCGVLNVVYPRDLLSVHFFLFSLLMVYVMYLHYFQDSIAHFSILWKFFLLRKYIIIELA